MWLIWTVDNQDKSMIALTLQSARKKRFRNGEMLAKAQQEAEWERSDHRKSLRA